MTVLLRMTVLRRMTGLLRVTVLLRMTGFVKDDNAVILSETKNLYFASFTNCLGGQHIEGYFSLWLFKVR